MLGVNLEASKPRCELYKLLLYETGPQYVHTLRFVVQRADIQNLASFPMLSKSSPQFVMASLLKQLQHRES